jgi:glycosyltransferase involved in cell wall biosynthesis
LPVAYVLGTFPQASQTFIAREIRGLRRHGLPLLIFALTRKPADVLERPDREWYGDVRFAPLAFGFASLASTLHFLATAPAAWFRTFASLLALPHRPRLLTLRAVALMMKSAWIAREIERAGGCRQIHAHFALAQTEVAMAVAGLLGCPFSFTAHARDIYAHPSALPEKIRAAAVVVTCTGYNVEYMRRLCPEVPAERIRLVHHGVEARGHTRSERNRPTLLAAGRLIEKKGFETLIDACRALAARGVEFRCRIFGTGPLLEPLRRQVHAAGLASRIDLPGWAAPEALADEMSHAVVFTMPSRISRGGDRDGIPNVVLEAMAAGLPVVATAVSGLPEAVVHGETGFLVEPDQPEALAAALERLLTDRALARRLGAAGQTRILDEFTLEVSSRRLSAIFGA